MSRKTRKKNKKLGKEKEVIKIKPKQVLWIIGGIVVLEIALKFLI